MVWHSDGSDLYRGPCILFRGSFSGVAVVGQRFLVWLGHVSYGIYLWHFQVMRVLVLIYPDQWNTPAMSLLALAISLPTTLILAAVSYYTLRSH